MRRMKRRLSIGLVAIALLAILPACGTGSSGAADADTVHISRYFADGPGYDNVRAFADSAQLIVIATLAGGNDMTARHQPSDDEEGVLPGDGPDYYGVLSFTVEEVVKGSGTPGSTVSIHYRSGAQNGSDKRSRIAYLHEALWAIQREDTTLRTPEELAGRRFVVFAVPNTTLPVGRDGHVLANSNGIAELLPDGALFWGEAGVSPIVKDRAYVTVSLTQLRAAAA